MASTWRLARLGAASALLLGALASPAQADANERGAELYLFCQQCHATDGGGNERYLAPSIAGLPEWYGTRQLQKFHSGIRGGNFYDLSGMRMRPMSLWLENEDNMEAVAQYIAAMPPVKPAPTLGGDPARGEELYATCVACHGREGKGNEALGAPPLNHASDWYLLTQLKHFKARIRGGDPRDTQGAVMVNFAMLLPDEQAMKDVIAYIMTFPQ